VYPTFPISFRPETGRDGMDYRNQITRDTGGPTTGWLRIRARYPTRCLICGKPVKVGSLIRWNPGREGGVVTHYRCRLLDEK
jgi:hypothetical protein